MHQLICATATSAQKAQVVVSNLVFSIFYSRAKIWPCSGNISLNGQKCRIKDQYQILKLACKAEQTTSAIRIQGRQKIGNHLPSLPLLSKIETLSKNSCEYGQFDLRLQKKLHNHLEHLDNMSCWEVTDGMVHQCHLSRVFDLLWTATMAVYKISRETKFINSNCKSKLHK